VTDRLGSVTCLDPFGATPTRPDDRINMRSLAREFAGPRRSGDSGDRCTGPAGVYRGRWLWCRPGEPGIAAARSESPLRCVGVDLFLADLVTDGLLVGDGVLGQPDPFHGRFLGVQGHLVL
jgi:hypothetical protein